VTTGTKRRRRSEASELTNTTPPIPPNARPARHRSQTLTLGGRPGALNRRKPVAGGRRDRAPTADRRGSSAEAPSGRRGKGGEPEPPTRAAEARIGEGSGGVRKVEVSKARCRATLRPHRRRRLRQRPRPRTRGTTTITASHPPAGSCVTPSPAPPLVWWRRRSCARSMSSRRGSRCTAVPS